MTRIVVCHRDTASYAAWKQRIVHGSQRARRPRFSGILKSYVVKLFAEEEDQVDCLVVAVDGHGEMDGFAMLSNKLLAPWVPPEWTWEFAPFHERFETVYTHKKTGRVVHDDLDEVWTGRHETDADIFSARSAHILLICATRGTCAALMGEVHRVARRWRAPNVSLGAAHERLVRHYRDRYGFSTTHLARRRGGAAFIEDWNRAYAQSGLYGTFMSKATR